MGRPPSKTKYLSVSLPAELVEQAREAIERDDSHFFTSVPDFIKHAVRRALDELDTKRRAGDLGRRLDSLRPDVDRAAAKLRAGPRKFCHKCGAELRPDAAFCSSCGTKSG